MGIDRDKLRLEVAAMTERLEMVAREFEDILLTVGEHRLTLAKLGELEDDELDEALSQVSVSELTDLATSLIGFVSMQVAARNQRQMLEDCE